MLNFFPFHHCSLLSLLLVLILWSRTSASAKSNNFNEELEGQNSEKETTCDSETKYICLSYFVLVLLLLQAPWKSSTLWYTLFAGEAFKAARG